MFVNQWKLLSSENAAKCILCVNLIKNEICIYTIYGMFSLVNIMQSTSYGIPHTMIPKVIQRRCLNILQRNVPLWNCLYIISCPISRSILFSKILTDYGNIYLNSTLAGPFIQENRSLSSREYHLINGMVPSTKETYIQRDMSVLTVKYNKKYNILHATYALYRES